MNKDDFIINNTLNHKVNQFDKVDKLSRGIYKTQIANREKLLDMLAKNILIYPVDNTILKLSTSQIKKELRLYSIFILNSFKGEQEEEKDVIEGVLTEIGKDTFNYNTFLFSLGIDFNLNKIDSKSLEKIINKEIDGEIWSSRLWANKKEMANILQSDIKDFLEGRIDVNKIYPKIKERYNQNAYNTKRLFNTETARVQSQVNEKWSEDLGIEWQLYSATLDGKTSNLCRNYDGKKYKIDCKDKPIPPLHPNCRSCLISLPYKDYTPPKRYDNEKKQIIPYKDYEKWKEENNIS